MKGTAKQIEWANKIREAKLSEAAQYRAEVVQRTGNDEEALKSFDSAVQKLTAIQSAPWWIDNRSTNGKLLVKLAHNDLL